MTDPRSDMNRLLSDGDTPIDRRTALVGMSAAVAGAAWAPGAEALARVAAREVQSSTTRPRVRRIATEEAFTVPEIAAALRDVVRRGGPNLDLKLLRLIYDTPADAGATSQSPPGGSRDDLARTFLPRLLDIGAGRLAEMDASGVDMHLLSLTMPGVQMFDPPTAISLARLSNDRLSDAVRRHPTRFAGLASFAPQDPVAAAKEMERAINTLKLSGFVVNSHTQNGYLDEERFWPILEAAEALGAPLYIHPRAPSDGMAGPFRDYRMEGSIWGYGMEAGTHGVRLILSGVLDRFPRLRIILGHMGEALPFWLWRLDYMAAPGSRADLRNQLKASEYFRRNFAITTSGLEDPLVLRFCIDKIGIENVMWAIDYPYQPTAPAVAFLESAPLSGDERERVAHGNAERIFRLSA
jgi:5-carboxyvanillate decarboxylase